VLLKAGRHRGVTAWVRAIEGTSVLAVYDPRTGAEAAAVTGAGAVASIWVGGTAAPQVWHQSGL